MNYARVFLVESNFGADAEALLTIQNGKVNAVNDISIYTNNYAWDGFPRDIDSQLMGKTIEEVKEWCKNFYIDVRPFEDEYRNPFCLFNIISKEEYDRRIASYEDETCYSAEEYAEMHSTIYYCEISHPQNRNTIAVIRFLDGVAVEIAKQSGDYSFQTVIGKTRSEISKSFLITEL